jgi:N,N'-diacetyllegionaminate synthase
MSFYDLVKNKDSAYIIAEGADAHYGSIARAKEMIEAASDAGADAIKFQHHLPDAEMLPDIPMSKNMKVPLYEFLKKNALTIEQHVDLFEFAESRNIQYLCTPFSYAAAQELEIHIPTLPAFKIGSGEMMDFPSLEKIIEFNRPMIISTGMSEKAEIYEMYEFVSSRTDQIIIMNCTSAYPPSYKDLHLKFISELIDIFPKSIIGHSDHTNDIYSSIAAIALGAKVIEKHVTVDSKLSGPDADVSITFNALEELVKASKKIAMGLNANKQIHDSEKEIISWARRSLVYTRDLQLGHILTVDDIWTKRPGTGIPSKDYWKFLGKKLNRRIEGNTLVSEMDFEN